MPTPPGTDGLESDPPNPPVTPGAPPTPAGRRLGTPPRAAFSKARRPLARSTRPSGAPLASRGGAGAAAGPGPPTPEKKAGLRPITKNVASKRLFFLFLSRISEIGKRQGLPFEREIPRVGRSVGRLGARAPAAPPSHPPPARSLGLTGPSPHSPSIPAAVSVTGITRHGVNGCGERERPGGKGIQLRRVAERRPRRRPSLCGGVTGGGRAVTRPELRTRGPVAMNEVPAASRRPVL